MCAARSECRMECNVTFRDYLKQILKPAPPAKPPRVEKPYERPLADRDFETAFPLLLEACKQEDADAMTFLASLYYEGYAVPKSHEEAALWYRQAATRGQVQAQAALGSMLADGLGLVPNPDEAAYWLYRSAKSGHGEALDWLTDLVLREPDVAGVYFTLAELTALRKQHGMRVMMSQTV